VAGPKKDFFISYAHADRRWAEWIAWQLENAGYMVVLQAWDFRPGSNFVLDMHKAALEAARTIAVLSPDYLKSIWTQVEWAAAFDPTGERMTLIPVRVRECTPEGLLARLVHINLVGLDEAAAAAALLAGVGSGRAKPVSAPAYAGITADGRTGPSRPRYPGALPPIWNVPYHRNPNFTGRREILADLQAMLDEECSAALTQVISGLGGVGKTQIALEYAYRHAVDAPDYDLVWWVRADEPAILAADYACLAGPLGLPEAETAEQAVTVQAVRRWLGQNRGWLLILDNAGDPATVRNYLPQARLGHALITSRNPNWKAVGPRLEVKVMKREEAVDFLCRRTKQVDVDTAATLASDLGHLPLALEQAGAYIEATGMLLTRYLELYRSRPAELQRRGKPLEYPDTVASTWEMSFERLVENSPAAADLLRLCSFLAPDDIPLEVLGRGAELLPQSLSSLFVDPVALNDTVAALRRYSLIEATEGALSVHLLVQAVTRDRLTEKGRENWAAAAAYLLCHTFPFNSDDVRAWPECSRLLSHALAAAGHAEELVVAPHAAGRVLNMVGGYLYGRAQFMHAKLAFERALSILEGEYGPNHPHVAATVNNLGEVLRDLGDFKAALTHLTRALKIDEATCSPGHPRACDLNNLGTLLGDLGDVEGARAHLEQALKMSEAACGSSHPSVAVAARNLGILLGQLGDLDGAEAHVRRALRIFESACGAEHPHVAACLEALGHILSHKGDLEGARKHHERALRITEAAYGTDHPATASCLSSLALILEAQGDLERAGALAERAVEIMEAAYGSGHPAVATCLNNWALVLHAQGDLEGARRRYEQALKIDEVTFGPDNPKLAPSVIGLVEVLSELGDVESARGLAQRKRDMLLEYLGKASADGTSTPISSDPESAGQ